MNYVISTGGGIIENRLNRDLLKRPENYVIWLNPEWNILYNRIANSPRPLVQKLNKEQLYKLCQNRGKYYQECADVCVEDVSSLDPEILK
jgi:shikimate kinase